jgi:S-DNA-T family DNA segregation ATPase FtsK/SpoIIIE
VAAEPGVSKPTTPPPGAAAPSPFLSGAAPIFQRAPRAYVEPPRDEVEIAAPLAQPPAPNTSPFVIGLSMLGIVGGVAGGIAYAVVSYQSSQSGSVSQLWWLPLLSVVMMLGSLGGIVQQMLEPRRHRREMQRREQVYRAFLDERTALLERLQQSQRTASLIPNPPLDECLTRVEQRDRRLWERTLDRDFARDFLSLRLGIGTAAATFTIKPPQAPQFALDPDPLLQMAQDLVNRHRSVGEVAVTLPLAQVGSAGLAGPRESLRDVTRALLLHLATHHAPSEIKLVLTFPELEQAEWEWARWLPHTWNEDRSRRFLASAPEAARRMLVDLAGIVKQRQLQRHGQQDSAQQPPAPIYVFVFADPALLSGTEAANLNPLLRTLLNEGPALGAHSLFLVDRVEAVRKECGAVIDVTKGGFLRLIGPPSVELAFAPDAVDAVSAERFARTMAPLRLQTLSAAGELPRVLTLLDMLGAHRVEDLPVARLWQDSKPSQSIAAPIGVRGGGDLVRLDIHERGHGPHGLSAGTTGSGKSELLQTLIASLAVHYSPNEVAFVLIDYKGGGMAAPFRDLPHQAGIITNLDAHLVPRAIGSLTVENRRRQELFDQAGVKNIDEYLRLHRAHQVSEPLPHLLVIADEFAELAQSQTNLMKELISIARTGRSTGVHLLLATQKPAGVVNDQIWSNSNFRLCLRVADPGDSQEMLKRPDAAQIPNNLPGRGYFQVGMNEVFELFQAGYSGAAYAPASGTARSHRGCAEIRLDGSRRDLGQSAANQNSAPASTETQLQAVVRHVRDVARREGIPAMQSIWLPPLPETLTLDSVRINEGWDGQRWEPVVHWLSPIIGLLDDPDHREQRPLRLDIGTGGHLAVYGAPGTGKTVLLQTILTALAQDHSPDQVNFYILDFGGRMLRSFEPLPHVGAVILPDEAERVKRLARMLIRELDLRKELLSQAGIGTMAAYHAQVAGAPPAMVVAVDNYVEFANAYPDQSDMLARVAREGGNLGIHLIITANTINAIPARLASNISLAIALELNDPGEYAIVVGRTNGLVPERGIRGRGLIRNTPPLEFQTALPVAGQSDSTRSRALQALLMYMRDAWTGTHARQVRVLPDALSLIPLLPPTATWASTNQAGLIVPLGLDADTMEPFTVDLAESSSFLITGPPSSGKTWLLQTWLLALAEQYPPERVHFYLCGVTGTRLLPFRQLPHTMAYIEDGQRLGEVLEELRGELEQRRRDLDKARRDAGGLVDETVFVRRYPAIVVVIDDADQFRGSVDDMQCSALETLLKRGRGLGFHLLYAGPSSDFTSSWDTLTKAVKDGQTGFMLGSTDANDLAILNFRLPPEEQSRAMVPGRGYFARRGRYRAIHGASVQTGTPSFDDWLKQIVQKTSVQDRGE